MIFPNLVVVEKDSDPGFDRGHDVVEQVFLHRRAVIVGQVTNVNGEPDRRVCQVVAIVTILFRLLQDGDHRTVS